MDILVHLIIWALKAMDKSRRPAPPAPRPAAIVGKTAVQPRRTAPAARSAQAPRPAARRPAPNAHQPPQPPRAVSSAAKPAARAVVNKPVPPPSEAVQRAHRLAALRIPMILGDVLAPPLALRSDVD